MKSLIKTTPLLASIALLIPTAKAVDVVRANNSTSALNTTGAWALGVLPTSADVIVWDSTFTAVTASASLPALGADLSVAGIRVANVGGTRNASNTSNVGFTNASSANTLTIGAAGVDMSGAFQSLRMDSKITIGASQTWNISDANTTGNTTGFGNGEDLAFQSNLAAGAFSLGSNTVTTTGAGHITITSGYTLDNGTINIGNTLLVIQGGGNRLTTVNNNVNLNVASGSILHFQSNSGAVTSNAAITLNGGTLKLVNNNTNNQVTVNNSVAVNSASTLLIGNNVGNSSIASTNGILFNANLTGTANLTATNNASTASVLVMNGDNSGYSGTITLGGTSGRNFRINSANAGSANATWNIGTGLNLTLHGVNANLGTLSGAGNINNSLASTTAIASVGSGTFSGVLANGSGILGLTKVGTGTLNLIGANTYSGNTTVNQGTLITTPVQTGSTQVTIADGATFGVKLAAAGTTLALPNLTAGTTTGSTISFDINGTGNPTAPLISSTIFTPSANTTLRLLGSYITNIGTPFPLLSYTGSIGGAGFAGLNLSLPFRVNGNLVDDNLNSRVAVEITGTAVPAWRGNINGNWDVDNVGDGSVGTANWSATSGPNTYVQGAPVGTDSALFDDTATGTTTVNLTTTLTPLSTTVFSDDFIYTFQGTGKISGTGALTKSGTNSLIIANTGTNDYTGTTTVNQGNLVIGDGTTNGAGNIPGAITVNNGGTLIFNRPDAYTQPGAITGAGNLTKLNPNTVTLTTATTISGAINNTDGTLILNAGGTLTGPITNSGTLTIGAATTLSDTIVGNGPINFNAGTSQISGSVNNTNTGLVTINAGLLQLNKAATVNAVGGDITIAGTGQLALLAAEQIPDTSSVTLTGTSTDSIPTQTGETFLNLLVNSSTAGAAGGQVILKNGTTITGIATLNSGVLGVGSGQTGTLNTVNITSAPGANGILRVAGNSNPSTLNIGTGGITASGGEIQIKFNTNNFDAIVNLAGNFTATGNVAITNAGYTGTNANIINLTGTNSDWTIATGTTTTLSPDIGGTGSLTKKGEGTLTINSGTGTAASAVAPGGGTFIEAGTILANGSISGTIVVNGATAILGGSGTVGDIALLSGTVAPGNSPGLLTANSLTMSNGTTLALEINSTTPATGYDQLAITTGIDITGALLAVTGSYINPMPAGELFFVVLNNSANPITGTFAGLADGASLFSTSGQEFKITYAGDAGTSSFTGGNDIVLMAVPEPTSSILALGGLAVLALRRRRRA